MGRRFVFRDARGRAAVAVAGLLLCAAMRVAHLGLFAWVRGHLGDPTLADLEGFEQGLGVAVLVCLLCTAIAFILWLRRAYENAAALGMRLQRSLGWAVGGWFVPFVNLFVPFQVVRDTYLHAAPGRGAAVLGAWWGCYLVGGVVDNVSASLLASAKDHPATATALALGMGGSVLTIVSALAAVTIVRGTTRAQEAPVDEAVLQVFGDAPRPGPRP